MILSFLTDVRDIVQLRCVSRKLRCASETPSLWREFIWPHLDINEERCVNSVLKSCGSYVKRLGIPDHVKPSQLKKMLQHCSNLVELSIPTSNLNFHQVGKIVKRLTKLRCLDILWPTELINHLLWTCGKLNELTIRVEVKKKHSEITATFESSLYSWLNEWVRHGFLPRTLKIVFGQDVPFGKLVEHWFQLNPHSPIGRTGCLKVFRSLKVSMDLYPPLPDFQLQFGQLCTLPFVKPSQFGLLGLEHQDILLTDSTYCGKVVHRARIVDLMRVDVERSHFSSDFTRLSFVTHFDASRCMILHSGHLEQLAMACPNLYHLNLQGNHLCLERLQGLQAILACKNLQGLNLSDISRVEVECCVQLWKIFVDMRLTYLAIEPCALIPWEDDSQTKEGIIGSYHIRST